MLNATLPIPSTLIDVARQKKTRPTSSLPQSRPRHGIHNPLLKQLQHTRIDGYATTRHMNRDRKDTHKAELLTSASGRLFLNPTETNDETIYDEELNSITFVERLRLRNAIELSKRKTAYVLNDTLPSAQRYLHLKRGSVDRFCTNAAVRLTTKLEAQQYLDSRARGEDQKYYNPIELFAELVKERKRVEEEWRAKNVEGGEDGEGEDGEEEEEAQRGVMLINLDYADAVAREIIEEGEVLRAKVVASMGVEKYQSYARMM